MTIGSKCACIFDLVHCRVSHVYCVRDEPAAQPLQVAQDQQEQQHLQNVQLQPNRPIWIDSAGDCQTLALGRDMGGADESAMTILKVDKPSLVSGGSVIVMQRQRIDTPAKVSCIAAHPSDPSLALGLKVMDSRPLKFLPIWILLYLAFQYDKWNGTKSRTPTTPPILSYRMDHYGLFSLVRGTKSRE